MSKALPELVTIALAAGTEQLEAAERRLYLLDPSRQKALKPVFDVLKQLFRVQKKKKDFSEVLKKFSSFHEYKRKQVAELIFQTIAHSTPCNDVHNQIHYHHTLACWLMQKMLIAPCLLHIEKAMNLALSYDRWHLALDLARFRINVIKKIPGTDIEQKLEEHKQLVSKINNYITVYENFNEIYNTLYVYYKKHYKARDASLLLIFKKMAKECEAVDTSAMGFDIKAMQYSVMNTYMLVRGEATAALDYELKINNLWKQNPHRISHSPWRYGIHLSNLLQNLNAAENYSHHAALLGALKKLHAQQDEDKAMQQSEILFLELQWRMNTGYFKKALQIVEKVGRRWLLLTSNTSPSRAIILAYNCAVACFVSHQFNKALVWLTRIIAFSRKGLRIETRETSLLLRNIVYFELNKELVFPHEKNMVPKTKERTFFYRFEYELNRSLRLLNKSDKKKDKAVIATELKKLFTQLQQFEKQSPVKGIEGLEETKLWLQSRINGIPMHLVMFPKALPAEG